MTEERVKRKLSAILSADVVGYSRLMGEDEVSTVRTLEAYRKVMSDLIEQFRGRVVDSPGDNLLSEFSSVVDAVQCAVEIHEVIRAKNEELTEDRRMLFRIGVNLGDVIEEGDRIYGDGVNIAARLEGLAEAGGICISGSAHEQIENKLALGYEFLGEHTVKNIAKPVKVYRVPVGPKTAIPEEAKEKKSKLKNWQWTALGIVGTIIVIIAAVAVWDFYLRGPSIEPASIERMAYSLPDKPSIAVLPFTNMSGDPEQNYIGDGLSENIISALSVSSEIFVISGTTFTYKEKAVDVKQVAEDLGVKYILKGSIKRSGDQLRVNAQLIDALSGHHLWAEVYDREMRDLFELEDEITKKIVVSIQGKLTFFGEDIRVDAKSTKTLEAWKHYIKGQELFYNYVEEDNEKARQHLEAALALDPQYGSAMTLLGWTYFYDFLGGWGDAPATSKNHASEFAQKALQLNEKDPGAHALLGFVYAYQGQYEKAIFEGKRAISLNPNYAMGSGVVGNILFLSGEFDEANTLMQKAYRLNPHLHPIFLINLARSYIFLKRYEKALELCDEMEEQVLNGRLGVFDYVPPLYFSWIYQELGREEEARDYMREVLERRPDYSLEISKIRVPYKNPAHLQRMLDAYRKAGMPEHSPGAVQEKPSIAVLPFDNLSSDLEQEYFVLGLSEEILNSISKISGLHVTSKTSSFAFKDTNKTVKEIAEILERDYILEGSVRKAGDSLRITAQLINVADDRHLWSETYDRELRDIFEIQEDIAHNVADKLKLTLESLKLLGGTENIKAYELYLNARGKRAESNVAGYKSALEMVDEAIGLDPEFAVAWAYKAHNHILLSVFGSVSWRIAEIDDGLIAAKKAIELEPNLADGYINLGAIYAGKGKWIDAEQNISKALELTGESLSGDYHFIIPFYNAVGKFKRALELLENMRKNDPFNPEFPTWYYETYSYLGDRKSAEEKYQHRNKILLKDYSTYHDDSITGVRLGSGDIISHTDIVSSENIHIKLKKYLDSPKEGLVELHRIYSNEDYLANIELGGIIQWAAYFGDLDFAMEIIENKGNIKVSWLPTMQELRKTPRFKEFVRKIGLVDYWKEYGWPDLCRPVGDDDFVCD